MTNNTDQNAANADDVLVEEYLKDEECCGSCKDDKKVEGECCGNCDHDSE
ncbi:MAG: hypothetical protein HYW86_00870 [Candidatus Roizmanbacteria bacterium]|nr:MAG: hypothetical protein HYW86_00870 [Candidatus Roizmanbacteria bacterium]